MLFAAVVDGLTAFVLSAHMHCAVSMKSLRARIYLCHQPIIARTCLLGRQIDGADQMPTDGVDYVLSSTQLIQNHRLIVRSVEGIDAAGWWVEWM